MGASPHYNNVSTAQLLFPNCTYSLHPKSSTAVHHLEKVLVLLTPKPTEFRDLEIRPEMTHVVLLPFHRFGVDFWYRCPGWVTTKNLFGKGVLVIGTGLGLLLLLGLWLHEHFPKSLGSKVVKPLVRGRISENVWHSFLQLLDRNCESIGLIRFDHLKKWIAAYCQQNSRVLWAAE